MKINANDGLISILSFINKTQINFEIELNRYPSDHVYDSSSSDYRNVIEGSLPDHSVNINSGGIQ